MSLVCVFSKIDTPEGKTQRWQCPSCKEIRVTTHAPLNRECVPGVRSDRKEKPSRPNIESRQCDCHYLGSIKRQQTCKPCQASGKSPVDVYSCFIHGECTKNNTSIQPRIKACSTCQDYATFDGFNITPTSSVDDVIRSVEGNESQHKDWSKWKNVQSAHRLMARRSVDKSVQFPAEMKGRGIVVIGGGKYFVSAYVTIRVIRELGCTLPIELWHLDGEIDLRMRGMMSQIGVVCRNASEVTPVIPYRWLKNWKRGWQLKPFAMVHSSFKEVLMLDADSYPIRNPEFLFDWKGYIETGAIFWPDLEKSYALMPDGAFDVFDIPQFEVSPTESGQMVVDKKKCWKELLLVLHHNSHADFTYDVVYGDKDTFPISWSQLGTKYSRMWPTSEFGFDAVWQMDDKGKLLFLHRVHDKFRLPGTAFDATPQHTKENVFQSHFPMEHFCFRVLDEIRDMRTDYLVPSMAVRNDFDLKVIESVINLDEYFIRRLWKSGFEVKTMLDIGSHIGSFTRLVKHYWPNALVLAADADKTATEFYLKNTDGLSGVYHQETAIVAKDIGSSVSLIRSVDGNDGSNYIKEAVQGMTIVADGQGLETVLATDIETILRKYGVTSIDLLKLDCEGAEFGILGDLSKLGFMPFVGNIVGEWHNKPSIPLIQEYLSLTHDLELWQHEWQWGLFLAKPKQKEEVK